VEVGTEHRPLVTDIRRSSRWSAQACIIRRRSQIGDHAWPRDVRVGCRRVMPSAGGGPDVARRSNQGVAARQYLATSGLRLRKWNSANRKAKVHCAFALTGGVLKVRVAFRSPIRKAALQAASHAGWFSEKSCKRRCRPPREICGTLPCLSVLSCARRSQRPSGHTGFNHFATNGSGS
jgi:hypothetical protein